MPWTKDTTSGVLTKTTSDREAWTSNTPMTANMALVTQSSLPADNLKHFVFGTQDARSCWEAGLQGANVIVRKVAFATAAAASATAAHGLSAGVPYLQETRVVDKTITVFLNGSDVAAVTYTVPDNDSNLGFTSFGLVGTVDATRVLSFNRAELIPKVLVRNKILTAIGGGRLYASIEGDLIREVARGVARETGYVSMVEYRNKIYIADGQKWKIFDPVTATVIDWVPTVGTLPKFYKLVVHFGRIGGFTVDDPQNMYFSKLNDPLNFDTDSGDPGQAYAFPLARIGLAGQVIRDVCVGTNNEMILGGGSTAWRLLGDPAKGQVDLSPLSQSVGASGPTSMVLLDEGVVLMHSPAGLHTASDNGLTPINDLVLTRGIRFDPADRDKFTVSVVRDPLKRFVFVFMLNSDLGALSQHFAYSERVGGYGRDTGGMFPLYFPAGHGPTASIVWDSKVLMGCEDGYIRVFSDDAAVDDDDGVALVSKGPWQQVNEPGVENDTILQRLFVTLAAWSGPVTCRVWKGQTPEQCYNEATRVLSISRVLQWTSAGNYFNAPGAITQTARGQALVVEMYAASGRFGIEAVEATSLTAQVTTRHAFPVKVTPGGLCTFPGAGSGTGTGSGSGGLGTGPGGEGTGISGTGTGTGPGTGPGPATGTGSGWETPEIPAEV